MLKFFAGWLLSAAVATAFAAPALTEVHGVKVATQMASQAPLLSSHSVLVMNSQTGEPLYEKNTHQRLPIASITKLMTAMVVLDADLDLNEAVTISDAEIDRLKNTHSRLAIGTTLTRRELLLLALMSSENRAAAALARSYPGGTDAFVARMNRKARALGMRDTVFYDATGLNVRNSATAADLALMVKAANGYPLIRQYSTAQHHAVYSGANRLLQYKNSNALVREGEWDIGLQKTGYIQEAGRCLVMHATVGAQPLVIVLLAAGNPAARINDAKAIRHWLESQPGHWLAAG
ncbi:serine hydrolase [Crenobacter luteus]|uniref:Peptidase S11 n=1 Tax=Crenobacter luteus TaxID=1452487 RepID=A0A163D5K8_9NEIS|nr:serine hydrolase [Crenobacter luteus]KZE33911.1 peptidase S11 [Crenobacter luteus]